MSCLKFVPLKNLVYHAKTARQCALEVHEERETLNHIRRFEAQEGRSKQKSRVSSEYAENWNGAHFQMFARRKNCRKKLRQTKRLRQLQHIPSFANSVKKHIAKYDVSGFAKALKKIHKFIWHHLKQQLDPLQGQLDSPAVFIIMVTIIIIAMRKELPCNQPCGAYFEILFSAIFAIKNFATCSTYSTFPVSFLT